MTDLRVGEIEKGETLLENGVSIHKTAVFHVPVTSVASVLAAESNIAALASHGGVISIAQICGFSTLGVKVTLILPSVTSTGTVST